MNQITEINDAIRLHKTGQMEKSREILREFLLRDPANIAALLWLAKVSSDPREAQAAAELALALDPSNEIAQRAVAAVSQRFSGETKPDMPIDIVRVTGLTLAQARATLWPFRNPQGSHNRPMGTLFDDGKLSIQNQSYAVERAFDLQVQQAARTLLLVSMLGGQIKESPPALKVIQGSGYLARQERGSLMLSSVSMGAGLMIDLVAIVLLTLGLLSKSFQDGLAQLIGLGTTPVSLMLIGIAYLLLQFGDREDKRSEQFRAGREGEESVVDTLRASLSGEWTLIRNLSWLERKWSDVDLVLVGPGGIWAIEVKAYTGMTRNIGDRWQHMSRRGWRNMRKHPGKQARQSAQNVKAYLNAKGVPVKWVEALIVWAGDGELSLDDPATPVWKLSEFPQRIEEFWRDRKLDDEQIRQIVNILGEVVQKVKAQKTVERS